MLRFGSSLEVYRNLGIDVYQINATMVSYDSTMKGAWVYDGSTKKDNARTTPLSFKIALRDRGFVENVQQQEGLRSLSEAAYRIFECGMRLYVADCSHEITNDGVVRNEINS